MPVFPSDDSIVLQAYRRGWIADIEAVRALRAAHPDEPLLTLLHSEGLLTGEQVAALQPETLREGTVPLPAGQTFDPAGLQKLLGPPRADSRYHFGKLLGEGGMGEVHQALDAPLGRPVAFKRIRVGAGADSAAIARFVREARITAQLAHPNIVPVHDIARDAGGNPYYTMKQIEGESLAEILAEEDTAPDSEPPRLTLVQHLQSFLKVCDAIAFAHSRGVIHRDLKPANIMIGAFGEVLVVDWGLAKVCGTDAEETGAEEPRRVVPDTPDPDTPCGPLETLEGQVMGTPAYMPPEQAAGRVSELDARSDIYSLGAILYQLLTGEPPFTGPNARAVLRQVVAGELVRPSRRTPERAIPWELEAVVTRAMAQRRRDRYADVGAMKQDLEAYLEGRLLAAADYTAWQALKKWAARNKASVSAAAGILLALVAGFGGIGYQLRQANQQRRRALAEKKRAEDKEAEAQRQKERAEDKERQAQENLRSFTQMSDVKLLAELVQRSKEELWPPVPARIPAMKGWLVEARKLAARLGAHRTALEQLERRAKLDRASAWRRDVLQNLVPDLERFAKQTVADVERRIPLARKRHELSVVQHREAWARATRAIRAHPRYGGLVLVPQEGLVPLGPDPASTLWEFAEVSSGRLPRRYDSGKLQLDAQSAMVLVLLPRGAFRMGSTQSTDEGPVHKVRGDAFLIGKHEVTQGQWLRVMGENPSHYSAGKRVGRVQISLSHPVEQVSWDECRRMLLRIGLVLPSEAQWEYAARGGTRTEWWCGKEATSIGAGQPMAGNVADASYRQAGGTNKSEEWTDGHAVHAPIGSFRPNAFGLHDVIGNVWEWCRDEYFEDAYKWPVGADGVRRIPTGRKGFRLRSSRGGGWDSTAVIARSAYRSRYAPAFRVHSLGLRPAGLVTP